MRLLLVWVGRLAGALGLVVSAVAVFARASGMFHMGSFETVTVLQGGVAAMVVGCLAYVTSVADPASR
jgi:hypothetical protein